MTDRFKPGDKAVAGKLMAELTTTRYDGTKTMQQHVLDMENLAAKLAKLGMKVEESFLVQFILNFLPKEYVLSTFITIRLRKRGIRMN